MSASNRIQFRFEGLAGGGLLQSHRHTGGKGEWRRTRLLVLFVTTALADDLRSESTYLRTYEE
ncbi:hypothetical protein HJA87_24115 [Rhizobium bangladeshense]|uniref:Uncharacterized protein n=2 Tax=Rhizobium bangladeshense TaxID=1138189 RepID=A0ABS7LN82_9HYPH|nr:hypothetical protein [Rhizobium bangladeshense]MBX4870109.1 hypothetical protein [Rhizobium bangladeshense]MBX4886431.1 hypothetical protein [Rhizobium bangladeshense]MBX4904692.1 hypothetical protein [Rhizobium bangladeshense]MBX4922999.1 hypothetical protein [Rhizobium bangladeshense]MBX4935587.1 hypothetical protein [Rhizobium bangladeshense]